MEAVLFQPLVRSEETLGLENDINSSIGIKPNMCKYCGKGFTQKSNLTKHLKVHIKPELTERKRYSCPNCTSSYTERYNLRVSG